MLFAAVVLVSLVISVPPLPVITLSVPPAMMPHIQLQSFSGSSLTFACKSSFCLFCLIAAESTRMCPDLQQHCEMCAKAEPRPSFCWTEVHELGRVTRTGSCITPVIVIMSPLLPPAVIFFASSIVPRSAESGPAHDCRLLMLGHVTKRV